MLKEKAYIYVCVLVFGHTLWQAGSSFPDQGSKAPGAGNRVLTPGPPGKSLMMSAKYWKPHNDVWVARPPGEKVREEEEGTLHSLHLLCGLSHSHIQILFV